MAIEAKAVFMNELERDLSTKLTSAAMASVLSVVAERLSNYEVEQHEGAPEHDDLLDAYINAITVEGKSARTIKHYKYVITRMIDVVGVPIRKITVYHLRNYLSLEKARGISDRTIEGYRQTFSAFFNWLSRERLIDINPASNLGPVKYQKKQKDIFTEAEIERLKFGCKTMRDRAIVCFLLATGCRISEMTQLNRSDIDFVNMECKVLGKGNKERIVFLNPVAVMTLQGYIDEREDESDALFVGKGSKRLTPGGVRKMLNDLGRYAKVSHVHPHKFRRTTATTMIRHGMPIQEVANILGHDKLDTTMQYVILDKSDIKNSYRKYA